MHVPTNTSCSTSSFVVPDPLNVINNYLGVCLNCEFRCIYPHIREDNLYVTVEKQSKDAKKHADQIAVFKKVIDILKRKTPLCPLIHQTEFSLSEKGLTLCLGSFKESIEEDGSDNIFAFLSSNETSTKAEVLTSVFYDRIKQEVKGDVHAESFHRNVFADALEWYLARNLEIEEKEPLKTVRLNVNDQESTFENQDSKPRRVSSPTSSNLNHHIKSSGKNSGESLEVKKNPGSLRLSLQDLAISRGAPSPKKLSPSRKVSSDKEAMREALMKLLSLSSLDNCRIYWIESYEMNYNKNATLTNLVWDESEYCLINKHQILAHPKMHHFVQCMLSKDIIFDFNPHTIMQDIHRSLAHIDKDYHSGLKSFSRENIFHAKSSDNLNNKEVEKFDAEVSYFYYLLERLLQNLDKKNMEEQDAILNLWKECATDQLSDCNDQSFVSAGEAFFKKMNKHDPFNNKVIALLALLRQKNFVYPFEMIHRVTRDVPLTYLYDDPKRLIQFEFKDGNVEFRTILKAIPSKEPQKWLNITQFSGFEIELLNIMRSNNSELKSWSSEIIINVNIFKSLKNKHSEKKIPANINQYFIHPLEWVGFNIKVNLVEIGISKSS